MGATTVGGTGGDKFQEKDDFKLEEKVTKDS